MPAALGDTATIARWHYFRWRVETYHKLLKSAGWQLESWQQREGQGLLVKLMLALGACASIWALERRRDAEVEAFKKLLMQLSGRQTKRNREVTTSGLLAGLWVLQCAVGPLATAPTNSMPCWRTTCPHLQRTMDANSLVETNAFERGFAVVWPD